MSVTSMQGRVAVVTGSSRGIGLAVTRSLVQRGCRVVVSARGSEDLAAVVDELGEDNVEPVVGRIGEPDVRAAILDAAVGRWGGVDFLVNNVGINPVFGPLVEIDLTAAAKILETNILAATHLTQLAACSGLVERRGAVVNVASIAGLVASPGIGMYGVSKSAVLGLTRQFADELSPHVRVNAVAPAAVRTRFAEAMFAGHRGDELAAQYPLARVGEPADVAGPVAFLLSDDAAWITGQTIVIDGGASLRAGN